MSISSPQTGGGRRPSSRPAAGAKPVAKSTGSKAAAPKAAAAGSKGGGSRSGGGRPPITPVKVNQPRPWSAIALFTAVALVAVGIIGFGVYEAFKPGYDWRRDAQSIPGIVDYNKTDPALVKSGQHQWGPIVYKQSPPVAGPHNYSWMRCEGDVYTSPIHNEHAVHSLEHGAIWVTYRPDLPKAEVDQLASKVRGGDFIFMSPYPGLDKAISLQAWGWQLKLDNASDPRIDHFIKALRSNAQVETGATCNQASGNYITDPGLHNLGSPAASAPANPAPAPSASKS